jgi:2'-5' RNA ligase
MTTKRTFIAINVDLGPAFRDAYDTLREKLSDEAIRWVGDDKMHITLNFLGDTTDEQVAQIGRELLDVCKSNEPFTFELQPPGYFGRGRDIRFCSFMREKPQPWKSCKKAPPKIITAAGFTPESRPFSPHLTIGRIKFLRDVENFKKTLARFDDLLQTVRVNEVIFYESILKPDRCSLSAFAQGPAWQIKKS